MSSATKPVEQKARELLAVTCWNNGCREETRDIIRSGVGAEINSTRIKVSDAIQAVIAALNADGERIRRLEEALAKAGDKFDLYAQLHRLKCTAEGDEKADRNQEMADYCRSLSTPSKGVG